MGVGLYRRKGKTMNEVDLAAIREAALQMRGKAEHIIWKKAWLELASAADTLEAMMQRLSHEDTHHVEVVDIPQASPNMLQERFGVGNPPKAVEGDKTIDTRCAICGTNVKPPAELYVCAACGKQTCQLCFGCHYKAHVVCKEFK